MPNTEVRRTARTVAALAGTGVMLGTMQAVTRQLEVQGGSRRKKKRGQVRLI